MKSLKLKYLIGILLGFIAMVLVLRMLAEDYHKPNMLRLSSRIAVFILFAWNTISCIRNYRKQMKISDWEESRRQDK